MANEEISVVHPRAHSYTAMLPGRLTWKPSNWAKLGMMWPIVGVLIAYPFVLEYNLPLRILLSVCIFLAMWMSRTSGIIAIMIVVYLATLGGIRRNMIPLIGEENKDPLLIVTALIALLYGLGVAFSGRITWRNGFERLRLILLVFMVLEIFNPKQGGILVGVAGGLFYIVPIVWSFMGRDLGKPNIMRWFFYTIVIVATLGAVYGIKQGIYGLTPAEQEWLRKANYGSVAVGDELRPFSFFTSTSEYASFTSIGIVLCWVLALRGQRFALFPIPILTWGLFYTGIRTPIVLTLAACVFVWAVQGRTLKSWIPRAMLALVLAIGGLAYALTHAEEAGAGDAIVQHQTQGLLNPTDSKVSTVGAHGNLIKIGFEMGFTNPFGMGLGYTTLAAPKLGGTGFSTEIDITNMFVSLGFMGGTIYILFVGTTLVMATRNWYYNRTLTSLGELAILCKIGTWLNGGNYSLAFVVWFSMGAMVREYEQMQARRHQENVAREQQDNPA